ncbi:putative transporter [Lachnellula suecica]|uniref:Putative transporter n=1 Tax=Lachnellula suecica TaxID=602035 RepID=A0A8T9C594_9HELO|nr:putative transporter [Lachnellula suecica]
MNMEKNDISDELADEAVSRSPKEPHEQLGLDVNVDEAFIAVRGLRERTILDESTNKRILRKIDFVLMPILCIVYGLNYLDKTTLSYASITGIQKGIGLKGNQFSWLGSIFYFGYLGFEYPAVRMLQRFPLAKYSGICIIAWGTTLACFSTVKSFAGAVVVRLLLGVFEASVSPGWVLFTSQWYTKKEQVVRVAWWGSFNGFAQIFGGLVAYGIAHNSTADHFTLAPWKIIYLFTGLLTIVFGIVFLLVIPDNQLNAWWLTKEDRILAIERVRGNQQGIGNKRFKSYQFKEALLDPITWAFVLLTLCGDIPNGGLSNFFSLLLESFDLTAQQSLLYGCISGAVEIAVLLGWAYTTRYFGNRILWAVLGLVISMVGAILLVALPLGNNKGRLAGFYLAQFFVVAIVAIISLIASNVAGYTKKVTVSGFFFIAYCVGNIIGPQTFRAKAAPRYVPAEITLIVCYGLCIIDLLFIHWYYKQQNKKKLAEKNKEGYEKLENQEFLDLTDRENQEFVYEL